MSRNQLIFLSLLQKTTLLCNLYVPPVTCNFGHQARGPWPVASSLLLKNCAIFRQFRLAPPLRVRSHQL